MVRAQQAVTRPHPRFTAALRHHAAAGTLNMQDDVVVAVLQEFHRPLRGQSTCEEHALQTGAIIRARTAAAGQALNRHIDMA